MFFEASLPGFLRTVLIIIAVIAIMRFIGRLILAKKAQQLFDAQQQRKTYEKKNRDKEGTVRIFKKTKKKDNKINFDDEGEYVDYEEVE